MFTKNMAQVKFFGALRKKAGVPSMQFDGVTVAAVLEAACLDNLLLKQALFDGAQLRPHVRVMVNGLGVDALLGLDTPVGERDTLAIFPPLSGG